MNQDWHELIQRYIAGKLPDDEALALQNVLKSNKNLRFLYLDYMNLDVALGSHADSRAGVNEILASPMIGETRRSSRWFSLRPLTAAAAGLIIGAFSVTAVWAFTSSLPRKSEREMPLVDGSFEQTTQVLQSRPLLKNVWHGDPAEIVGTVGRISPQSGGKMLRFMASATDAEQLVLRESADMWQILDVPDAGPHRVKVRAWFAADTGADTSFVIMATALSCGLDEVNSAWSARFDGDPRVLSAASKTTIVRKSNTSWHLCELAFDVPAGARLLVVDLAGRKVPGAPLTEAFPGQFVDNISVSILD